MDSYKNNQDQDVPNFHAKALRHSRVFLRSLLFSRTLFRLRLDFNSFIRRRFFKKRTVFTTPIIIKNPFKQLLKQSAVVGIALLIISSVAPARLLETGFTAEYFETDTDYIEESDELVLPPFLMNEEGFVLKTSPASEDVSRIGYIDTVRHTVVSGDTLSSIAALYAISVQTLVWENDISEESTLRIGQTLNIPPLNGVSHIVTSKTETLSSIAKSYNVDEKLIKEHNRLESDIIIQGQKLFIPGGKKKEPPVLVRTGSRSGGRTVDTYDIKVVMGSQSSPHEGATLIYPTTGNLTQGFHRGHYALDIGNAAKPDVWAASEGTIIKSDGGCTPRGQGSSKNCNGGYGNHVIIDHGNGLQTLYAHLETIYVSEGQKVDRGQALGKMGNTGRAYGKTGIHLHFEVYKDGLKKNPSNFF